MARIAIIEDDVATSRVIKEVLGELGHETVSYFQPTGDMAEFLMASRPDLVILDLRFSGDTSGWHVIEAMKQNPGTQNMGIILCSGAQNELRDRATELRSKGIAVLEKPFSVEQLERVVAETLPAASGNAARP